MPDFAILDDNRKLVEELRALYEYRYGYVIDTYHAPITALPTLIDKPPPLLILNGRMLGMHGIEFFRRFRQATSTPVIFMSAWAEEIKEQLAGEGTPAEDYVQTPYMFDDLHAVVAKHL